MRAVSAVAFIDAYNVKNVYTYFILPKYIVIIYNILIYN